MEITSLGCNTLGVLVTLVELELGGFLLSTHLLVVLQSFGRESASAERVRFLPLTQTQTCLNIFDASLEPLWREFSTLNVESCFCQCQH